MEKQFLPVYIVSGGVGASGEQLVHTVLAQFPGARVPVITYGNVRQTDQIDAIIQQIKETGGILVHTLVDSRLRLHLVSQAHVNFITDIDLTGPLINTLSKMIGQPPAEQPGLYRKLRQDYFERVGAIEFTIAHDDGKKPEDWPQADVVIAGVSRVGKTPLSLYLSILGWKAANAPIVPGVNPPPELEQLDPRRVIGLTIEPGQLLMHRLARQSHLGAPGPSAYTDPQAIYEEVQAALRLFKRRGFTIIDVTDKPIETSADEIVRALARQTQQTTRRAGG